MKVFTLDNRCAINLSLVRWFRKDSNHEGKHSIKFFFSEDWDDCLSQSYDTAETRDREYDYIIENAGI